MSTAKREPIENVKAKHELQLLKIDSVQGVGITEDHGKPTITVYVDRNSKELQTKIPQHLEGYPVKIEVSGTFEASE